jgi:large subunit ribosomal protein L10
LDVDLDQIINDFQTAAYQSLTLAVELAYPTAATVPRLIYKAQGDALAVALETGIITPKTVKQLIAKAHQKAATLAKELKTKGE